MDKNIVIAAEEGIKRVVNNKALYYKLLGSFSGRKLILKIVESLEQNDFAGAEANCHALRGTAANLAMHALAITAEKVEAELKNGNHPGELIQTLQTDLEEVEAEIERLIAE